MKLYRIWFLRTITTIAVVTVITGVLNFVLDPLWCFGNSNSLNQTAIVIDQRQQKTNQLTFESKTYDAIIIGSSRSEAIPPDEFGMEKVFNYSVPAIFPDEYISYLHFAQSRQTQHLKTIYLGIDFFGSNRNRVAVNPPPETYFSQAERSSYRFASLFSLGPLRSWLKRRFESNYYYRYDRQRGMLIPRTLTAGEIDRFTRKRLSVFRENFYLNQKYVYNTNLCSTFRAISEEFPNTRIIPYTSPVSLPLLQILVDSGRYPDYEHWLRDIVETYGFVYHFMDANSITRDQKNFYDADHMYPSSAQLIAHRLTGQKAGLPVDFGIYITKETLEEQIAKLRKRHQHIFRSLERR